jgi:hypothetical protein
MKFILTVYICSLISGECVIPQDKESGFNYPKEYGTHYGCVRDGLGESFEILFNGDYFNADTIETYKLYPKFVCLEGESFRSTWDTVLTFFLLPFF